MIRSRSHSLWIALGAVSGMIAVAIGAFGAHGLKSVLTTEAMAVFQTGNQYAFYHSFALLMLGLWSKQHPSPRICWIGLCFLFGIILFSGSLYALTLSQVKEFGMITPIGGILFMVGWFLFALEAIRRAPL